MVLTILIFLLIICSFSVYAGAKFHKRFEEVLPITMMGMAAVLFLSGFLGVLKVGLWIILVLTMLFYLLSLYAWIRAENKKEFFQTFLNHFCTPGFFIFITLYFLFAYSFHGMKAIAWDDFTHWIDSVKVMSLFDDFATNPKGYSMFASYPPGLSLLQYCIQKIYGVISSHTGFSEWLNYFVYHIFFIAVLLPFTRKLQFKQWALLAAFILIAILVPISFSIHFYTSAYIDSLLSIVATAGFLYGIFFTEDEQDIFCCLLINLTLFTLVLLKDIGFLLALFVLAFHLLQSFRGSKDRGWNTKRNLFYILAWLTPKIMWSVHLNIRQVNQVFAQYHIYNSPFDVPYLSDVIKEVFYRLGTELTPVFSTNFSISHLGFLVIGLTCLYLLVQNIAAAAKQHRFLFPVIFILCLVFIVGIPFIYVMNFSEKEAKEVAEFARYISIPVSIVYFSALLLLYKILTEQRQRKAQMYSLILLSAMILFCNDSKLFDFLLRIDAHQSINARQEIDAYADEILKNTPDDARICIVFKEKNQAAYLVLKTSLKPRKLSTNIDSTVINSFVSFDAQSWEKDFLSNYDYLILYQQNDFFAQHFSHLFKSSESIQTGLYKLNSSDHLLYPINLDLPQSSTPENNP